MKITRCLLWYHQYWNSIVCRTVYPLGTLSAFKMLDASIVIHVAYNTTRDVRHDWHLLRHLASYPIALIPSPSYISIDITLIALDRLFLLRSGSIHVSINIYFFRSTVVVSELYDSGEIVRSIFAKNDFFKRRRELVFDILIMNILFHYLFYYSIVRNRSVFSTM